MNLRGALEGILGTDRVDELEKDFDLAAHNEDQTSPVTPKTEAQLNWKRATLSLHEKNETLRRLGKVPSGPTAAAVAELPQDQAATEEAQRELDPSSGPTKRESINKAAARLETKLPLITASEELLKLLKDGKVDEFNATRPAGRLDLRGISLVKRNLEAVDLRFCELQGADLRGADLSRALLQHADLSRADMEGTLLTGCKAYAAKFVHASLKEVKGAQGAEFQDCDFSYAEMQNGRFDAALFTDAKLGLTRLDHARFRGCRMTRACFPQANLSHANFEGALLDNARFFYARGKDVIFKDAILLSANMTGAEYTSSNQQTHDKKKTFRTTFEGAWTQGLIHGASISEGWLAESHRSGLPPEGLIPKESAADKGKVPIDGLPGTDQVLFNAAMAELNELVGLKKFKAMVPELLSHIKVSLAREQLALPAFSRKLHYVMTGPPGVGKTTCARILGKLFTSLGLLAEGHIIETDKSGFIAGFAGQTLGQTNDLINDALGGTLIADEIYAMTDTQNDDYAKDALAVLVKRLWDDRDKFSAFFLGYPAKMAKFIEANPGFYRRMAGIITFEPYSYGELAEIMKRKMDKLTLRYTPELLGYASVALAMNKELSQEKFGNAGTVENLVEDLTKRMSTRIVRNNLLRDKEALTKTSMEDLPTELYAGLAVSELPALAELTFIGSDGKTVHGNELTLDGEFATLSPESELRLKQLVHERKLELINTDY